MSKLVKAFTAVFTLLFCVGCSETTKESRRAAGGDPAI